MEHVLNTGIDPVRIASSENANDRIDREMEEKIRYYSTLDKKSIKERIIELDMEWDIERTLELNASLLALGGIILAATTNKKWLLLSAVVTSFLAHHAIKGWCPPLPIFRHFGIRTQKEIQSERHQLLELL